MRLQRYILGMQGPSEPYENFSQSNKSWSTETRMLQLTVYTPGVISHCIFVMKIQYDKNFQNAWPLLNNLYRTSLFEASHV